MEPGKTESGRTDARVMRRKSKMRRGGRRELHSVMLAEVVIVVHERGVKTCLSGTSEKEKRRMKNMNNLYKGNELRNITTLPDEQMARQGCERK